MHNEEVTRSPSLGKQKQGVLAVATTVLFSKSMPLADARLRGFIVRAHQGKAAQRQSHNLSLNSAVPRWQVSKHSSPLNFP